mmetsp:Transcript_7205/g.9389  ORF Transcript_7205/g.9389 Transcript_7205/m.9389 type:complete len:367 (-) Transcript_7205:908-2008(-)
MDLFCNDRVKFYTGLREAMHKARKETKKPIILCGDLNVTLTKLDMHYKWRSIRMDLFCNDRRKCLCGFVIESGENANSFGQSGQPCCQFKAMIKKEWPKIQNSLKKIDAVTETSTSSATGALRTRYRARIPLPLGEGSAESTASTSSELQRKQKWLKIGDLHDSIDSAIGCYQISPSLDDAGNVIYHGSSLRIYQLKELLKGVSNFNLSLEDTIKLSDNAGETRTALPVQRLMRQLIDEDNMIDTFRHLYPTVKDRYTCWDQYRNQRYKNVGSRIDYFLVDKKLHWSVFPEEEDWLYMQNNIQERTPASSEGISSLKRGLRCGCDDLKVQNHHCKHESSIAAGICAATAAGRFQVSSMLIIRPQKI